MPERSTPAQPQSNSSSIEIDHLRKTATCHVNIGQQFQQNKNKTNFSKNPLVPSKLKCIASFLFNQRLKKVNRSAGPDMHTM